MTILLDRESCKQYALANGFKWQENKKNWNPSSADSVELLLVRLQRQRVL